MTTFDELNEARRSQTNPKEKDNPLDVVKKQCESCPFLYEHGRDHSEIIGAEFGKQYLAEQLAKLQVSAISGENRICHTAEMQGSRSSCRGARNYVLTMFYRLGFIDKPTDKAFEQAFREYNSKYNKSEEKENETL